MHRGFTLAIVSAVVFLAESTSRADADGAETLRRDLTAFADALREGPGAASAAANLKEQVAKAEPATLQALADALADQVEWPAAREVLRTFELPPQARARAPVVEPGAPSDECPVEPFATPTLLNLVLVRLAFEGVAIGLHIGCDITVAGFNATPFCFASGVADTVVIGIVALLDTEAICNDETDGLAHDAAIETQAGMAGQLDVIESKLDANGGAAERTAERQLERQLRSCEPLVSLVLPRKAGGSLEDARDLVAKWLTRSQLAGSGDIPEATKRLQVGDAALAVAQYRTAYRSYCIAYRALVPR